MEHPERSLTRRAFLGAAAGGMITAGLEGCAGTGGAAPGKRRLSFGVVADAQYCDKDPAGSRFYRESLAKLAACVEELNRHDLDFTIHLGDLIDDGFESIQTLLPIYERLRMPHYHALGNHDFSVAEDRRDAVPATLGMPARYYDFRLGGRRFVVLDGNDVSTYANAKGSEKHALAQEMLREMKERQAPNGHSWNGAVGAEQLAWLRDTLSDARDAREETVVFCHFPVYPANAHNLWNDLELIATIEASGAVVAYINGHNHHGHHAVKNGIHYLTVRGMVETVDTSAFSVMTLDDERLEVDGFGRQADQVLVFGAASSG